MVFRMCKFIYTADNNTVGLFMSPMMNAKPTYVKDNNINAKKTHQSDNYAGRADNDKS